MSEEEQGKKQEPEKPKKAGGDINLKKILMVVGAVMVAQVVVIIVLFQTVLAPADNPEGEVGHAEKTEQAHGEDGEDLDEEEGEDFDDGENIKHLRMLNSQGNPDQVTAMTRDFKYYVVLSLGFKVKVKPPKEGEEEAEGGHGAGEGPADALPKELNLELKNKLNALVGMKTITEIQAMPRDSLPLFLKEGLKPLFRKHHMILKEVYMDRFQVSDAKG